MGKPGITVITVARKPISEENITENIIRWGSGGLDIDRCRLACGTEHMRGLVKRRTADLPGICRSSSAAGLYAEGASFQSTDHPGGRYPSNLILSLQSAGDMDSQSENASRYFKLVSSKPGITVVTVARKPLSGGSIAKNVLQWNCGGLNIGATRLSCEGHPGVWTTTDGEHFDYPRSRGEAKTTKGDTRHYTPIGRWPSNLVFSHLLGCEIQGTREVRSGVAGPGSRAWGLQGAAMSKWEPHGTETYGERGTETLPNWVCTEGCPIRELDRQSGTRKSGSLLPHHKRLAPKRGFGGVYGDEAGDPDSASGGHTWGGSSGGASRFFKQVEG